jgi:hypothetical protein
LEGLGHNINNLKINSSSDEIGLFSLIYNSEIRNLSVLNGNITGKTNVGMLAGYSTFSKITNVHTSGSVTGISSLGGLVGIYNDGTINSSYATGTISGENFVGGLVGITDRSSIINSYATGAVSGDGYIGGLVGENYNSSIANSYATGTVSGRDTIGGLVGLNYSSDIINSYAIGSVIGTGYSYIGGLVGDNLVSDSKLENSFWDIEKTGIVNACGENEGTCNATPLTTAQSKQQSSYVGWDFVNTWIMPEGGGTPILRAFHPVSKTNPGTGVPGTGNPENPKDPEVPEVPYDPPYVPPTPDPRLTNGQALVDIGIINISELLGKEGYSPLEFIR